MHFLDKVQLAYSCPLAWDKLVGGDERRFCAQCQKHVTNLSAMTRPQAEAWLAEAQDAPVCVRVEVDARGRAVHRPALRGAALAALAIGAAACTSEALDSADTAGGYGSGDTAVAAAGPDGASRTRPDAPHGRTGSTPPVGAGEVGPRGPTPGAPTLDANRGNAAAEQDFAARERLNLQNALAEPFVPTMGLIASPPPSRPMMGEVMMGAPPPPPRDVEIVGRLPVLDTGD